MNPVPLLTQVFTDDSRAIHSAKETKGRRQVAWSLTASNTDYRSTWQRMNK